MESTNPAGTAALASTAHGLSARVLEQARPQLAFKPDGARLTIWGVALVALQCGGLVFVVMALMLFPEAAQSLRLRTPAGLVVTAFILSGGLSCIALVLKAMGLEVVQRPRRSRDDHH
jgi:hypothetical protein